MLPTIFSNTSRMACGIMMDQYRSNVREHSDRLRRLAQEPLSINASITAIFLEGVRGLLAFPDYNRDYAGVTASMRARVFTIQQEQVNRYRHSMPRELRSQQGTRFEQSLADTLQRLVDAFQLDETTDLEQLKQQLEESLQASKTTSIELIQVENSITIRTSGEVVDEPLPTLQHKGGDERLKLWRVCERGEDQELEKLINALSLLSLKSTFVNQQTDEEGHTPLLLSAAHQRTALVHLLLRLGADPKIANKKGYTPLHWAAKVGNLEIAQMLVDQGADIEAKNENVSTPLHIAAFRNHNVLFDLLRRKGARFEPIFEEMQIPNIPSVPAEGELTPLQVLWIAAQTGQSQKVDQLITQYASFFTSSYINGLSPPDPDQRLKGGFSALALATAHQRFDVVCILLRRGADPRLRDLLDYQPLHWAAKMGYAEIARALLQAGAPINSKADYGRTPLHMAAHNGHAEMVQLLLERGADINAAADLPAQDGAGNDRNNTPLHEGVQHNRFSVVMVLAASPRLNVKAMDSLNHTPLFYAVGSGLVESVRLILNHGSWANPVNTNSPNHTLMLIASIENGEIKPENASEILKMLKAKG